MNWRKLPLFIFVGFSFAWAGLMITAKQPFDASILFLNALIAAEYMIKEQQ